MRPGFVLLMVTLGFSPVFAGTKMDSATVPVTLDHNRIIITVGIYLPNGKMERVRAWVDNGNPSMSITERLANQLELKPPSGSSDSGTVKAPERILIGGMQLWLTNLKQPVEVEKAKSVGAGIHAEITLSSTVLQNYDVVIDYPGKKFTIASPGTIHFQGKAVYGFFNTQNSLIQIPAKLDSGEFNLALDIGTPISFISRDLISKWSKVHASWPSMHGAIGAANLWGMDDEPQWQLLRINSMLYGEIVFSNFIAVSCPQDWLDFFIKRVGIQTAGLVGAEALLDYRLGIDYTHRIVYFQHIGNSVETDMNLVGITLRPETDGRYSILGVADYNGKPSVAGVLKGDILQKVNNNIVRGLTMGEVWSLLHGHHGTVYTLVLNREGKQFIVKTEVHRFLSNHPE